MDIYIPGDIDTNVVLGPEDQIADCLTGGWSIPGGKEPWPLRLYARLRKDPKAKFGIRASLFVDWSQGQDLSDPYWKQGVYIAVVTLWGLFISGYEVSPSTLLNDFRGLQRCR